MAWLCKKNFLNFNYSCMRRPTCLHSTRRQLTPVRQLLTRTTADAGAPARLCQDQKDITAFIYDVMNFNSTHFRLNRIWLLRLAQGERWAHAAQHCNSKSTSQRSKQPANQAWLWATKWALDAQSVSHALERRGELSNQILYKETFSRLQNNGTAHT